MDDVELDIPNDQMMSCLDMPNSQRSCSFDIDELLNRTQTCNDALGGRTEAYTDDMGRTQACTHAHACNPSGPDKSHTHTCIHVHTQIMPSPSETHPSDDTAESVEKNSKKRPAGNREAVRKYREKKKARVASLEDEVVKLRALNQQLMKRLQGQTLLEAEITRLKCLLVDIRGRIEGEIGSFPYQNLTTGNINNTGTYVVNPCNMQGSSDQLYCLHQGTENNNRINGQGLGDCEFDDLRCLGNLNGEQQEFDDCGVCDNVVFNANTSGNSKRKGARGAIVR